MPTVVVATLSSVAGDSDDTSGHNDAMASGQVDGGGSVDATGAAGASGCAGRGGTSGSGKGGADRGGADRPRVPVLACADALRRAGATVELVTAHAVADLDPTLAAMTTGEVRLVVAATTDAEVRAVVRRLVRRYAPPPSQRPPQLPANRTVFDLPPVAVLPLAPARPDLVDLLGVPADPADVAAAVITGQVRRFDLLRTDAGSVTLGGALIGGITPDAALARWRGRIEVDDRVLTDGSEPVLACSIRSVGSSELAGLPLVLGADATDGRIEVAVAVPRLRRRLLREASVRVEVRRTRGRAASVTPRDAGVPYVDDGTAGTLTRKRSWWVEPGAWASYVM